MSSNAEEGAGKLKSDREIIYVGDPMCSWCWGFYPTLKQLSVYCTEKLGRFRIVVGGLRPGGGEPWNEEFRNFLRVHWQRVAELTGQPFGLGLLDRDRFNYDTEPACRAVVTARSLLPGVELGFFGAVQRKFYEESQDPTAPEFYSDICARFGIDSERFLQYFGSDEAVRETQKDFALARAWNVTGFPSVLLRTTDSIAKIASGFSTFEDLRRRIEGN